MTKFLLIGACSVTVSCFGQILLKLGARRQWPTRLREYLNVYVLGGYALMGLCMLVTVYVYTGLALKYGAVLESMSYFLIAVLSRLLLGERIGRGKAVGIGVIILGILVFNLEWILA